MLNLEQKDAAAAAIMVNQQPDQVAAPTQAANPAPLPQYSTVVPYYGQIYAYPHAPLSQGPVPQYPTDVQHSGQMYAPIYPGPLPRHPRSVTDLDLEQQQLQPVTMMPAPGQVQLPQPVRDPDCVPVQMGGGPTTPEYRVAASAPQYNLYANSN